MKKILLYTNNKNQAQQILTVCKRTGISVKRLSDQDLSQTIGSLLLGTPGPIAGPAHLLKPQPDFMAISGLSDSELDQFLTSYREAGIPPISCKAVVTPGNVTMTAAELIEILKKESKMLN